MSERECPESRRGDGRHTWRFDGDDPYVVCWFCGQRRDALTGNVLAAAGGFEEAYRLADTDMRRAE